MKRHSTCLALALVTAFAIAGCGQDNGRGNDNTTPVTSVTVTPTAVKTATRTSTPSESNSVTVTPTPGPTGSGETPTPAPTSTGGVVGVCESPHMTITITSLPGTDLSTGWEGISHHKAATEKTMVTTNLECSDPNDPNACTVDGSALVGQNFGAPLPLSAGGTPACVLNVFREAVTGTYNCLTGCGSSAVKLTSFVFLSSDIAKPCPLCVGDPTPNDGVKGGTCDSGASSGAPCDVGGFSPDFGSTSNDCKPSGFSVGELAIDIDPLTTGTVSQTANALCATSRFGNTCFSPDQDRPNACVAPKPEGTCPDAGMPDTGLCDTPIDTLCSNQQFRKCSPGSGTKECESRFPGAGECDTFFRSCFNPTISLTGKCGTQTGTLVGLFFVPATRAAAINTVSGLPGPGAVSLPVSSVRRPR